MDLSTIIQGIETADALCLAGGSTVVALISEFLPQTKIVKANSICQLIFNLIKTIVEVFRKRDNITDDKPSKQV